MTGARRDANVLICFLTATIAGAGAVEAEGDVGSATFDFSQTSAARHLPKDYFQKHVPNKAAYAKWMHAHRELQAQLAPKRPFTDEELFSDLIDLSYPGLGATREAVGKGDLDAARQEFAAFAMRRFAQQEPTKRDRSELSGWAAKVQGWPLASWAGRRVRMPSISASTPIAAMPSTVISPKVS